MEPSLFYPPEFVSYNIISPLSLDRLALTRKLQCAIQPQLIHWINISWPGFLKKWNTTPLRLECVGQWDGFSASWQQWRRPITHFLTYIFVCYGELIGSRLILVLEEFSSYLQCSSYGSQRVLSYKGSTQQLIASAINVNQVLYFNN